MFWTVTLSILQGCSQAVKLFFLTLLFALPLGLVVAFGSMSKWAPFRALAYRQQEARGFARWLSQLRPLPANFTEDMILKAPGRDIMNRLGRCILAFYGPGTWFGTNPWNAFRDGRMTACCIAFIINYACYFSVIYRGGIEGVPAGQREAGEVLGLTKRQIFFKITLLQMVKRIIPPMSNEIITLVKDTSLARTIAIIEITMAGEAFMKSKGITWPLFYTGVFYLAFVGLLTLLFSFIERKLSYFK